MSEEQQEQTAEERADEARIEQRAALLPEEQTAGGSDDPEAQAEAILEESDERVEDPAGTQETYHQTGPRTSEEASHTPTGA